MVFQNIDFLGRSCF